MLEQKQVEVYTLLPTMQTEALLTATELRFPTLLSLAQERVKQARQPENLRLVLIKGVKTAAKEESARFLLDLLAA